MNKRVRKAVRTFLIRDNKIVVIKYKTEKNKDYYDIPGGKIEENETAVNASIREFAEEVGMQISNLEYKGNVVIEYPHLIFDFDVFIVGSYEGVPKEFVENTSMWLNIDELFLKEKKFPCIEIIKYLNQERVNLKILSDANHNIVEVENLVVKDKKYGQK